MQCLRCEREHTKPFLHFFCLFSTVLYCNCVKLKYAPCCLIVVSKRFDLRGKPPGPGVKSKKGQWICPSSGFRVKFVSVLGVHRFPPPAPHPHPACTAYVSVHKKQQQVLLVKKKQRHLTRPHPEVSCGSEASPPAGRQTTAH